MGTKTDDETRIQKDALIQSFQFPSSHSMPVAPKVGIHSVREVASEEDFNSFEV